MVGLGWQELLIVFGAGMLPGAMRSMGQEARESGAEAGADAHAVAHADADGQVGTT